MDILVGPTPNISILPRQKWPKIKMAAISPNFEVRAQKLLYNPKLYMLLGVCGKKYQKPLLRPQKLGGTSISKLAQTWVYGGLRKGLVG